MVHQAVVLRGVEFGVDDKPEGGQQALQVAVPAQLAEALSRKVKMTVSGPFAMMQQAQNDFYKSDEEAAMDYAAAVNAEIRDVFAAGADIVQVDEPHMQYA